MEEIKNPEKQNIILALGAAIIGFILIFVPYGIKALIAYHFYFVYFGIVIIAFGLGFALFHFKRYKQFDAFLEKKDECLVFDYDEDYYLGFIGELNTIQSNANKKNIYFLLAIELVISVALFFLLDPGYKWISGAFFIFFAAVSLVFTLIMPKSFKFRAMVKPYQSIIGEDSAYIMGRFHKWKRAKAKIKDHHNGEESYKVLAINYEAMTRNGKLFQEWTALIPNPKDKDAIASAKSFVTKINKLSRVREEEKKDQKGKPSYLERLFYRMLGRNEDGSLKNKDESKKK